MPSPASRRCRRSSSSASSARPSPCTTTRRSRRPSPTASTSRRRSGASSRPASRPSTSGPRARRSSTPRSTSSSRSRPSRSCSTVEQVRERVLSVLADEARLMLDEGVAQAPMDIDLAMITGAGFQLWNGGITPLLDRTGVSEKVTGTRFLPRGGERPRLTSQPTWPAYRRDGCAGRVRSRPNGRVRPARGASRAPRPCRARTVPTVEPARPGPRGGGYCGATAPAPRGLNPGVPMRAYLICELPSSP